MQKTTVRRAAAVILAVLLCCGMFPAALAAEPPEQESSPGTLPSEPEVPQEADSNSGAGEETAAPTETVPQTEGSEPVAEEKSALELYAERLDFLNTQDSALDVEFCLQPSEKAYNQMMAVRPMAAGDHDYTRNQIYIVGCVDANNPFYFPNGYKKDYYLLFALDFDGSGVFSRSEITYCIEPSVHVLSGNIYNSTETSAGVTDSSPWGNLSPDQQKAIGLTVLYGYPNGITDGAIMKQRLCDQLATATIIHEIAIGWRSPLPPYQCTNSTYIDALTNRNNGAHFSTGTFVKNAGLVGKSIDYDRVQSSYNRISSSLARHTLPSFAKTDPETAPTYTMLPTGDGRYAVTLTDTIGTLPDFRFPALPGVTFLKEGNSVTITAESCDAIPTGVIKAIGKDFPSAEKSAFLIWNGNKDGKHSQDQICLKPGCARTDPIPAYFRLAAPPTGSLKIVKSTNTGADLGGWSFGVYKDSACKKPVAGSPFRTNSHGLITQVLPAGTYYVKELDAGLDYWHTDPAVKKVTVTNGAAAAVSFRNIQYGRLKVTKHAVHGSAKNWVFDVYSSGGKPVATLTTDSSGTDTTGNLLPGTYTVRERHDKNRDYYWTYDVKAAKTVTVRPGATANVSFTNTENGRIRIQKALETDGHFQYPLNNWLFEIRDASGKPVAGSPFRTDGKGQITTGKLAPGTYRVKEILPPDSLFYCKTQGTVTVKVAPGKTATVRFTNALRPGKISILKQDPNGTPLADAGFLLEWSDNNGASWHPVKKNTQPYAVTGGCSSPPLTASGTLVTGADGLAVFTGLHPELTYRLTETQAPAGYQLLKDTAWEGKLPEKGLTVRLKVINAPVLTLPQTGSRALPSLALALGVTLAGGIGLMLNLKKKEG